MLNRTIITAAVLAALSLAASTADATSVSAGLQTDLIPGRLSAHEARAMSQRGDVLPSRRIISAVRTSYPDMILDDVGLVRDGRQLACPGDGNGSALGPRYLVKIRTQGASRVDVVLDARTAELLCER